MQHIASAAAIPARIAFPARAFRAASDSASDFETVNQNLRLALDLAVDCGTAYKSAPDPIKRLFNQAFFEKVFVMQFDEYPGEVRVTAQHRAPFDVLLGRDLKRFEADSRQSRESGMPRRSTPKMPAESRDSAYHRDKGFNKTLLVALSIADTNKWSTLLEKLDRTSEMKVTAVEYERTSPIRQRQRRLTEDQAKQMAARYHEGRRSTSWPRSSAFVAPRSQSG